MKQSAESNKPVVSIVMGSQSDYAVMKNTSSVLTDFGVPHEVRVISAHRTPDVAHAFSMEVKRRGVKLIIAAAGKAAHLAGVLAAGATIPVIGVPMKTSDLGGLDSLLSMVQMPAGIPVGTVAIGAAGAKNAALFAVEILALSDDVLSRKLDAYRIALAEEVKQADAKIQQGLET